MSGATVAMGEAGVLEVLNFESDVISDQFSQPAITKSPRMSVMVAVTVASVISVVAACFVAFGESSVCPTGAPDHHGGRRVPQETAAVGSLPEDAKYASRIPPGAMPKDFEEGLADQMTLHVGTFEAAVLAQTHLLDGQSLHFYRFPTGLAWNPEHRVDGRIVNQCGGEVQWVHDLDLPRMAGKDVESAATSRGAREITQKIMREHVSAYRSKELYKERPHSILVRVIDAVKGEVPLAKKFREQSKLVFFNMHTEHVEYIEIVRNQGDGLIKGDRYK